MPSTFISLPPPHVPLTSTKENRASLIEVPWYTYQKAADGTLRASALAWEQFGTVTNHTSVTYAAGTTTMSNVGIDRITFTTSTPAVVWTIPAPEVGSRKVIIVDGPSTAVEIHGPSTVYKFANNTTILGVRLNFAVSGDIYRSANMVGVSTSQWVIISALSGPTLTTA